MEEQDVVVLLVESPLGYLAQVRQDDTDWMPGHWELVGGKVEVGETVFEAAARELKEETNLDASFSYEIGTTKIEGASSKGLFKRFNVTFLKYWCDRPDKWVLLAAKYGDWYSIPEIFTLEPRLTSVDLCLEMEQKSIIDLYN